MYKRQVFGGAQSIHTNGKDEAVSLPSEENATTALRIQQIIAHESGVANYIDPLGDSSVIKDLTDNIVKEVELKIEEIFEKGGMKTLIERGEIQSEIEKSAFEFQEDIDSKKTIFVGVNKFINENEIIDSGTSFKDSSEDRLQRLNIFNRCNLCSELSLNEVPESIISFSFINLFTPTKIVFFESIFS